MGIPAVWILGIFHRKKDTPPTEFKRIALLKTAGIGDTIILSGVIADIRNTFPDYEITLICGQNNYEISMMIGGVDNVVNLKISNFIKSIKRVRSLGHFDAWLDFGPWPRFNSIITHFADAAYKVGFKTTGQYRHYIYDKPVAHIDHVPNHHELLNYRNIVREIGVINSSLPSISLDAPIEKVESHRVAVHIFPGGSRSHLKEWPTENWIKLLDWFTDGNYDVYLTGGKGDVEGLKQIRDRTRNPERISIVAGKYSLKETAQLLRTSKLVISVDTGIMHLASALDCNLISLHGPTSLDRWGPLSKKAIPIKGTCECSPCIDFGFDSNCRDNKCMRSIEPDLVIKKCREVLAR